MFPFAESLISNVILNGYRRIMYKNVSMTIIISFGHSTLLIVPWAALQHSHAQSNSNLQSTALNMHKQERDAVKFRLRRSPGATVLQPGTSWASISRRLTRASRDTIRKSDLSTRQRRWAKTLRRPPHGELGRFLLLRRSP